MAVRLSVIERGCYLATASQLAGALARLHLPGKNLQKFLRFHERAHRRAVTATMLGKEAGYKNYRGVNLQYGKLAKKLDDNLPVKSQKGLALLCEFFEPGEITNTQWVLIMREEFAEALKSAQWI